MPIGNNTALGSDLLRERYWRVPLQEGTVLESNIETTYSKTVYVVKGIGMSHLTGE
jgi:hypothetical protein